MKNLILLSLSLLLFLSNSYSQSSPNGNNGNGTCKNRVSKYDGPNNTNQLEKLLKESTDPTIQNLDSATKSSLVQFMLFVAGHPKGMSGTDDNIKKLFAPGSNGAQVLSAIFGVPVIITTDANRPVVTNISFQDFMALFNSNPTLYAFTTPINVCVNCYYTHNDDGCCAVGGDGCYDEIVLSNGAYYRVF